MNEKKILKKGVTIVYYGDGKGKTEAAFGLAMRAAGHHYKVAILQFIKSNTHSGEVIATKLLEPYIEIYLGGIGFVGIMNDKKDLQEHRAAAARTLSIASRLLTSGDYYVVILDELLNAVHWRLIEIPDVVKMLKAKHDRTTVVLTGMYVYPEIVELADIVTEMKKIKHIYDLGYLAKLGVDF